MKTSRSQCLFIFLLAGLLTSFTYNQQPPTIYKVDVAESNVLWRGYYLFSFGEHYGSIKITKGEIEVDNNQITGGYFEMDMKSIKDLDMPEGDGGKDLENHLMSDDFFGVDKFPTATFTITKTEKIKDAAAGHPNIELTGELLLKGKKNSLTFPALIIMNQDGLTASAKFKFDRTKWNVHYNSGKFFSDIGDGAISDAIAIELDLVAAN